MACVTRTPPEAFEGVHAVRLRLVSKRGFATILVTHFPYEGGYVHVHSHTGTSRRVSPAPSLSRPREVFLLPYIGTVHERVLAGFGHRVSQYLLFSVKELHSIKGRAPRYTG